MLHTFGWVALYFLPYLLTHVGKGHTHALFSESGDILHLISFLLLILFSYINYLWLIPHLYSKKRYIIYALILVISILIVIWFPNIIIPSDGVPPQMPPKTWQPPLLPPKNVGPPPFLFGANYNIILFIISTFVSITITERLRLSQLEQQKLNAELSFLKTQINPHFLFNTLNSIYSLSIEKSDETPNAIIQLSELMRYILSDVKSDYVKLEKELSYINSYISLQKRRLGDTVKINYEVDVDANNKEIAPLILMSFIENAFKHGVNPDKDSEIFISIVMKGKLHLHVKNNKVTSRHHDDLTGIGLENTKERLQHFYAKKHDLIIEDHEKTFSVHLSIVLE